MDAVKTLKTIFITVLGVITAWLGALAIPVYLLVACNVIDYVTGILAAHRRGQKISSYTGINGIAKKICMWLLIGVGGVIDCLLSYAGGSIGVDIQLTMGAATLTAIWLLVNEIISILENLGDIGTPLPGFLVSIVNSLQSKLDGIQK